MSPGRDPPFFAGSILGLRAWSVEVRLPSSATRLGAAAADAAWEPTGAWTHASCRPPYGSRRRHRAPRPDCSCGLYALHPRQAEVRRLYAQHIAASKQTDFHDPSLVEQLGVVGFVEAAGRIEVHASGFRAERARPVALVAGRRWPRPAREAVAELAALYGAELLVASGPRELLAFAEERGGALSEERVAELLPEPETEPEVAAQGQSAAGGAAAPPRTSGGRLRTVGNALLGILQMLFQVFAFLLVAGIQLVFALAMLGFGVGVVGGILFGWFETEPRKPPARVESVQFDRERCVIHANVVARRRLGHLDLRVAGRLGNGDGMGHFEERVGPVERGRSRILVAKLDSSLCRSHHTFTTRVRPVWPELKGKPAEVKSVPSRQETPGRPTEQGQ